MGKKIKAELGCKKNYFDRFLFRATKQKHIKKGCEGLTAHAHTHTQMHTCTLTHMHLYTRTHTYKYRPTHKERERDRETERERERETDCESVKQCGQVRMKNDCGYEKQKAYGLLCVNEEERERERERQ